MWFKMDKAAYVVLKECMNLKTNERFLVVYDKNNERWKVNLTKSI